jgi:hypothetical protein
MHCWPAGQAQLRVLPHESLTLPQRRRVPTVHVKVPHPASVDASVVGVVMHALSIQDLPAGHPPQLTPTPHESSPMTPHLPVHERA